MIEIKLGDGIEKKAVDGKWPNDTLAQIFDGAGAGYELYVTASGAFILYVLSGTAELYCTVDEINSTFLKKYGEDFSASDVAEYLLGLIGQE